MVAQPLYVMQSWIQMTLRKMVKYVLLTSKKSNSVNVFTGIWAIYSEAGIHTLVINVNHLPHKQETLNTCAILTC